MAKVDSCLVYAVSLAVAGTCLGLVVLQASWLRRLQTEVQELRQWTGLDLGGKEGVSGWEGIEPRRKRGLPRRLRRAGRFPVLHLHPLSSRSYDEDDYTLVLWAVGRSLGDGLALGLSGETVTIATEGTYFIYSQVLYKDTTWTMGHVIKKRVGGAESSLMKCIQSMPSNITVAENTCYTAGVHYLEPGSTLQLSVPRKSAGLVLKAHATFLGMFRI